MSDRFDVATRKGLFTFRRGAGGWEIANVAFLGKTVTMSLVDPRDGAEYAAVDEGHFGCHLHRSRDGGATWDEVAVPRYPEGATLPDRMPTEAEMEAGESAPRKAATLSEIWSLEPAGEDQPGALWCGTIPGGLFRSDDAGDSWRLVESLWDRPERDNWFGGGKDEPGLHSIVVDPRDPKRVALAVSCGGVWTTDDRGATWTELEAVDPSVFGFAVAVHPRDPDTAWFVPAVKDESRYPVDAALAVAKTTDGGASFTAHRAGLPQRHAYDIVYRHALDVDGSGERLAFGSSTGGVWTSEDGGANWTLTAPHLPPVYAVRFASV